MSPSNSTTSKPALAATASSRRGRKAAMVGGGTGRLFGWARSRRVGVRRRTAARASASSEGRVAAPAVLGGSERVGEVWRGAGGPVAFEVRDKPASLKADDWARVVAVFVLGKEWQFKDIFCSGLN